MTSTKETDLYYPLNRYFSALGYIVNTEVENKYGHKRADIILTKDGTDDLIGIETKTSLNFEVLDQAKYWSKYTDKNFVCVPKVKTRRPSIIYDIFRMLGVGLIEIDLQRYHRNYDKFQDDLSKVIYFKDNPDQIDINKLGITLTIPAHDNNPLPRNKKNLRSVIYKEHQTWAIGGQQASNTYVSGYKLLMNDVYKYLRSELENEETDGWVTLTEIINYLNNNSTKVVYNHYKNMRAGLRSSLNTIENTDIEHIKFGRETSYRLDPNSTKYINLGKK